MAKLLTYLFLLNIFCNFTTTSNIQSDTNTAIVKISCKDCIGKVAVLGKGDLILNSIITLDKTSFDSAGLCTLRIPLSHPSLAFLNIIGEPQDSSNSQYYLYLEPSKMLTAKIEGNLITFNGKLTIPNKYLNEYKLISKKTLEFANNFILNRKNKSQEDKLNAAKYISIQFDSLNLLIQQNSQLSKNQKEILLSNNKFFAAWKSANIQGTNWKQVERESSYSPELFLHNIPISKTFLNANMDNYRLVIDQEIKVNFLGKIYFALKKDGKEKFEDSLALISDSIIRSNIRLSPIKEFLLASNISIFLKDFGINKQVEANFNSFKSDYPVSKYLSSLESELDKYYALSEGKPISDFIMADTSGNELKLSDLRGKIVYMDTWATWCTPCIEEFKYSKLLIEHFKKDKNVVFLFVSVDDDESRWKSFLKRDIVPLGHHVIYSKKNNRSLVSLYRMSGIPHYLLVDEFGKIKLNRATRPSDNRTYELISGLVNNN